MPKQEDGIWGMYSEAYLTRLKRFKDLAQLEKCQLEFLKMAVEKKWKYTTCASYWAAVMWNRQDHGIHLREDARLTKYLEGKARIEEHAHPKALQADTVLRIWRDRERDTPLASTRLAIALAWICGQRISDVLKIKKRNVSTERIGGISYVTIHIREGKTTETTAPYVLFLKRSHPIAIEVLHTAEGHGPLCNTNNLLVRQCLKRYDNQLQLGSIRRGGLMDMARHTNMSLSEIRSIFSKHTSERMLLNYLNWGACSKSLATAAEKGIARLNMNP